MLLSCQNHTVSAVRGSLGGWVLGEREVIVAHATSVVPVSHVRSTLIQSSLGFLRNRGHFDAYLTHLEAEHRATILESLSPTWLPIAVGVAHYAACDALALGADEHVAIGEAVGDRIQGTFLGTLARTARAAGVTPWTLFSRFDRLWERLMLGGSVSVLKTGPKDLQVEIRGCPLVRYAYFRTAFTGVVRAGTRVVGVRAAYASAGPYERRSETYTMRASWV